MRASPSLPAPSSLGGKAAPTHDNGSVVSCRGHFFKCSVVSFFFLFRQTKKTRRRPRPRPTRRLRRKTETDREVGMALELELAAAPGPKPPNSPNTPEDRTRNAEGWQPGFLPDRKFQTNLEPNQSLRVPIQGNPEGYYTPASEFQSAHESAVSR